jgi:hypothetical protein
LDEGVGVVMVMSLNGLSLFKSYGTNQSGDNE